MRSALFLDFDGVLNSGAYLLSRPKPWNSLPIQGNEHLMLDPVAVDRLNQILEATDACLRALFLRALSLPLPRARI